MTLRQAKQIVRFLLDPELYDQYSDKLGAFFDMGQKRVAATTDFIERHITVVTEGATEIDFAQRDAKFYKLHRITGGDWDKLSQTRVRLQGGEYDILYYIYPETITEHTAPDYEFEISEAGQAALPYYVAAQVTISEHDLRYHQVYSDEFAAILENVDAARRDGLLHFKNMEGNL